MWKKITPGYVIGGVVLVGLIIFLASSRGPTTTPGVSQTPGTPTLRDFPKNRSEPTAHTRHFENPNPLSASFAFFDQNHFA